MGLLSPWFLLGLATLAVPVLVHLVQRETRRVVPFPSLMFLRKIARPTAQRRRVQHWPLLLVRLLALAAIVAAFARPYAARELPGATVGARDIVVLLDRSYSMGTGTRWSRAQAAVTARADALRGDDRLTLISFAAGADVVVEATADRTRVRDVVARLAPGYETTRLAPALQLAAGLLASSPRPARELVIVSDFPAAAWSPADTARLPAATLVTPVAVTDPAPAANLSLLPPTLARTRAGDRERVAVTAGVVNRGPAEVADVAVTLEADDQRVQTVRVRIGPQAAATVAFAPLTLPGRETRLRVRLPDDALAADNVAHAVAAQALPLPVTLVAGAGRAPSPYLRGALAAGGTPGFAVTALDADRLTADAVAGAAAVVVDDVALTAGHVGVLAAVAARGGTVVLLAGPRAAWPVAEALPAATDVFVDRSAAGGGRLGGVELAHPVFAPFRTPRSGAFSAVRIYGARRLRVAAGARVLARFDDGAPALVEQAVGSGRVFAWASSVDPSWTDLPMHPVFLPLIHQLVHGGQSDPGGVSALTVGHVLPIEALGVGTPARTVSPSGRRRAGTSTDATAVIADEPGIYTVRGPGAAGDAEVPTRLVAVNVDAAEADPARLDPATLASALESAATEDRARGAESSLPVTPAVQEQRQRVWWYLLAAGMLLLGAETLLARRIAPRSAGAGRA